MYEAKFILGALAGTLSASGKLGYVCDYPIYGQIAAINAFAIGAQMTNPNAKVFIEWSSIKGAKEAVLDRHSNNIVVWLNDADRTRVDPKKFDGNAWNNTSHEIEDWEKRSVNSIVTGGSAAPLVQLVSSLEYKNAKLPMVKLIFKMDNHYNITIKAQLHEGAIAEGSSPNLSYAISTDVKARIDATHGGSKGLHWAIGSPKLPDDPAPDPNEPVIGDTIDSSLRALSDIWDRNGFGFFYIHDGYWETQWQKCKWEEAEDNPNLRLCVYQYGSAKYVVYVYYKGKYYFPEYSFNGSWHDCGVPIESVQIDSSRNRPKDVDCYAIRRSFSFISSSVIREFGGVKWRNAW
jgi:hypothetical protein